ncbi:glutamate--tRNA ligase [bacterium]|nr:glutamate--tRNA ligase [bacterium]
MSDSAFRVRFAPSPTGLLHIGNARTAVLNWMLARHYGGQFILRIEDTDTARSSPESEESILQDLCWLGLDWQEGPDCGGPYGPYRQSERGPLYWEAAERLVDCGEAYVCHASDSQLEAFRAGRLAAGEQPVYRGELSGPEVGEATEPSIRLRVPEGESAWADLVKGEVAINHDNIGDFVLLRADGRPTYNFAVVVDDIRMRISHVVRGDDHLSNTPRQLMLYRALRAAVPDFAHIPMILGPDHQRLSKRHGATSVGEFRLAGYLPQALINYLSLLSWSSPSGEEFLSVERLCAEIDFERLGRSAAVFDPTKLRWLNGRHIRTLEEPVLVEILKQFTGGRDGAFSEGQFRQIAAACRDNLELLEDIKAQLELFEGRNAPVSGAEELEILRAAQPTGLLENLATVVGALEEGAGEPEFKALLKQAGQAASVKGRQLYMPVRVALTGRMHGPELPRIMAVLGPRRVAGLLRDAVRTAQG